MQLMFVSGSEKETVAAVDENFVGFPENFLNSDKVATCAAVGHNPSSPCLDAPNRTYSNWPKKNRELAVIVWLGCGVVDSSATWHIKLQP